MADLPDTEESPFGVTPGQGSDVTTTSAAGSSRRPGLVMQPVSVAGLLPWATAAAIQEGRAQKGRTMRTIGAQMTGKIITVSSTEIMSVLSCSYPIPLKHLIFAQLLICAPLFVPFLFTFPAAQFTCCC